MVSAANTETSMQPNPPEIWLLGQTQGIDLLAQRLRQLCLGSNTADSPNVRVEHYSTSTQIDPNSPQAPQALIYVAPKPAAQQTGQELVSYTCQAMTDFMVAAQLAVRRMARERINGSIIIVTDSSGAIGRVGHTAEATLGGALIGAAKCLAKELGRHTISVNILAYGFVPELGVDNDLSANEQELISLMNIGRNGSIDHLYANISHLIQAPHFLTGQVLHMNDGLVM